MPERLSILALLCVLITSCSNTPRSPLPPGVVAIPRSVHEHAWTTPDGVTLPYTKALPASGLVKAVVIHITGVDGVTGDMRTLTQALTGAGYAVYGSENRSFAHGPPALRGDAQDWQPWVEDLRGFMRLVRTEQSGKPVIWHSHSFGAVLGILAAATFSGKDAPDGLIAHSPGFALMDEEVKPVRGLIARSLAWCRVPQLRFIDETKSPLTSDPQFDLRWVHSEDRVREGIKVRLFIHAAKMGREARMKAKSLPMPVLALWGGADLVALGGKKQLQSDYDRFMRHELAAGRATPFYRQNGHHLLTEGHTRDAALAAIIHWLRTHVSHS